MIWYKQIEKLIFFRWMTICTIDSTTTHRCIGRILDSKLDGIIIRIQVRITEWTIRLFGNLLEFLKN